MTAATRTTRPRWAAHTHTDHGDAFHMSQPVTIPTQGGDPLDVSLSRLDDGGQPGTTTIGVHIGGNGIGRHADLTPAQVLALADVLRDHALTAAGRTGLELPVEQVRLGDEIHTADGWDVVEQVHVDGWCCGWNPIPGHRCLVRVATDAHGDDEDAHRFSYGETVRVRKAGVR